MTEPVEIPIRGEMIRLGQLLKLAGVAQDGGEAKALLADGVVTVEARSRRGAAASSTSATSSRSRAGRCA